MSFSTHLVWSHPEFSVGLATAKHLDDIAALSSRSLALESMLSIICDGDHSYWASWIGRDMKHELSLVPSLPSHYYYPYGDTLGDCNSSGLGIGIPSMYRDILN
jgi:hypothetical protein